MSCVVAYKESGSIYIASDSLINNTHTKWHMKKPKFFHPEGNKDIIVCWSGNARIGQMSEYVPFPLSNDYRRSVIDFSQSLASGITEDIKEAKYNFIVAFRGGSIYTFEDDLYVMEVTQNYQAIGSGSDLALGALYSLEPLTMKPLDKVKIAIEAASLYDIAVGGKIFTEIL